MDITTAQPGRSSVHPLCSTSDTSTGEENETAYRNRDELKELNHQSVRRFAPLIGYLILLMVIGIAGNSVTCYIYKKKMKKTTTNRFIIWLAVVDLIVCVIGIPFEVCDLLLKYLFDQPAVCKIFFFIIYSTCITSLITLVSIAIDRHYKICKPLKPSPTRKYRYFILGSAIIGSTLSSPIFYVYGISEIETCSPGIVGHSCTIVGFRNSAFVVAYFGFLLFLSVFGLVCLSVLYTCIGLQIWKRSRSTTEDDATSKATDRHNKSVNRTHRATVTCVAITIVFVIAISPTLMLHFINAAKNGFTEELSDPSCIAYRFFLYNHYLSNVLNPVFYGFLNPVFRRECVLMIKH